MTKETAIIVDDDHSLTEIFSEMLQLQGIEIVGIGHDGIEGVELFEKFLPNLVFMDVHMPKLGGVDALRKIKEIDSKSKVVMVTSDTTTELESQLKEGQASAIMYKPFDIQKIIKITKEIANSQSMLIQ